MAHQTFNISTVRHPHYLRDSLDWQTWRDTFEGGEYYRDNYLVKFSNRETDAEFKQRRDLTPIPTFARSAILDVRNNIYQRLVGVTRVGGPQTYQDAVAGIDGGVNGEGSTMDSFIGKDVLTELLLMGRVGVYVDAAAPEGPTLADRQFPPYLTHYRVEDILSYSFSPRGKGGEFQSVLLRDWNVTIEQSLGKGITLPNGSEQQFRLVWKDEVGQVWYKLYDAEGNVIITDDSVEGGAVLTNLKRVPFVLLDIGESLMKDVASYQKALLNLSSNDVFYAIKSNTPFLTIQRDPFAAGDHLKGPETAEGAAGRSEDVGSGKGRYYSLNEKPPAFIAPPPDTLLTSMKLQDRLEENIRHLINLAVQNKAGSRTESAESKKVSQGGLEAGLSFIGLELERGEKLIADIWSEYDNVRNPNPASVKYPDRYILKSDAERIDEAKETVELISRLPGQKMRKEVAKLLVESMLDGKVDQGLMDSIKREIDAAKYITTSDIQYGVIEAHGRGLVDDETASAALGYDPGVVEQARKDRAARIEQTLAAQTPKEGDVQNPAARGVPELDTNPSSGADERDEPTEPSNDN